MLRLFLLSNYGLVVATPDGIFYINQAWVYLLTFDPQTSSTYLTSGSSSIQVRECDLLDPNIKRELREAKYSLRQDVLAIEMSKTVVFVRFVYSQYHLQRIHTFGILVLPKEHLAGVSILSSKNSLCTAFSSHELCLFRHEGSAHFDKNLPVDSGDVTKFLKLQPIPLSRQGVCRVRYNINRITDLTALGPKSKYWDYVASLAGEGQDYFALIQDGIKFNSRDKYQADQASKVLLFTDFNRPTNSTDGYTVIVMNSNNQPNFLKITTDDRLQELLAHETPALLLFDSHYRIVSCHTLPAGRIVCQVYNSFIFLRSDESDVKVLLPEECLSSELHLNYLFIHDKKLNLSVYSISKQDGKIKCTLVDDPFASAREAFEGKTTAFSIGSKLLAVSTLDGYVHLFTIFEASNILLLDLIFRANFLLGSPLLKNSPSYLPAVEPHKGAHMPGPSSIKNELDDQIAADKPSLREPGQHLDACRSITDLSWKLSFPLIFSYNLFISRLFHLVIDRVLFLVVQLSSGELLVYRSMSLDKDSMKVKRVALDNHLGLRVGLENPKQPAGESFAAWVKAELSGGQLAMSAVPISERLVILSATNSRTSILAFSKGEVFVHAIKGITEESVQGFPDGCILFKDSQGLITLRRLFEPLNYCVENRYPFVSYSLAEKIIKVVAVEKDGCSGLVLMCKQPATGEYRLLLFDLGAGIYTDELKFAAGERISNLKKLILENRNFEAEDTLCVMYIQQSPESIYSKWRIVRFTSKSPAEAAKKNIRFDVREEYTDQETNELITTAFNIGETLFLAIENRIVQMRPSGGYKVVRTYYPNTSYIVDACVNNNSVVILNIKGTMIFMIWMKDQNKLVQKTETLLCQEYLYESRFLDSRQTKIVCSDADKSIHLVKVYTESLSDGREDITLKINKLQRIRLSGKVVAMDSLKGSQGLILACSNGAIEMLQPKSLKACAEETHKLYKILTSELPYPAGISPLNSCFYKANKDFQKMEKREYYKAEILNLFSNLSLPWQSKLATALEQRRDESANYILESLVEK